MCYARANGAQRSRQTTSRHRRGERPPPPGCGRSSPGSAVDWEPCLASSVSPAAPPLLLPALLALLGASGSLILTLNTRLVQWSGLLFLGSLLLCAVTLLLLAHSVTVACAFPQTSAEKRERADE